jgi:hypothetical protein
MTPGRVGEDEVEDSQQAAALGDGMGRLLVEDKMGFRQVSIDRLVTVGRSQSNDLVLGASFASRRHAWIWRQGDQAIIEDLGSTNGTYVNGRRLTAPRFLGPYDVIQVGEARLTFVADAHPWAQAAPRGDIRDPAAGPVFCVSCGMPSGWQARYCANCGTALDHHAELNSPQTPRPAAPGHPVTPAEPVVVRPFPTATTRKQEPERGVGLLILLLAILAAGLLTILAILLALVLG